MTYLRLDFKFPTIWIALFISCAGLYSCAGRTTPIPDFESREARVYLEKCSACHSLPHPKRHYAGEWTSIVKIMKRHMEVKGLPPLKESEEKMIVMYLQNNSR